MEMDKHCSDCPSHDNCSKIYEQAGASDALPVGINVVLVFMLPILLFIATLIVCDKFISIENNALKTGVSAFLAFFVTWIYLLIARKIVRRRVEKLKENCKKDF